MLINLRKQSSERDERQPSPRRSQAARARLSPLLRHSHKGWSQRRKPISAILQARFCPYFTLQHLGREKKWDRRVFLVMALVFTGRNTASLSGKPYTVIAHYLCSEHKIGEV